MSFFNRVKYWNLNRKLHSEVRNLRSNGYWFRPIGNKSAKRVAKMEHKRGYF